MKKKNSSAVVASPYSTSECMYTQKTTLSKMSKMFSNWLRDYEYSNLKSSMLKFEIVCAQVWNLHVLFSGFKLEIESLFRQTWAEQMHVSSLSNHDIGANLRTFYSFLKVSFSDWRIIDSNINIFANTDTLAQQGWLNFFENGMTWT